MPDQAASRHPARRRRGRCIHAPQAIPCGRDVAFRGEVSPCRRSNSHPPSSSQQPRPSMLETACIFDDRTRHASRRKHAQPTCYTHNGTSEFCKKPAKGTCYTTGGVCPVDAVSTHTCRFNHTHVPDMLPSSISRSFAASDMICMHISLSIVGGSKPSPRDGQLQVTPSGHAMRC